MTNSKSKSKGEYFGLDISDLEDVIIKNKNKILLKKPLKPDHKVNVSRFNDKYKKDVFEECELCGKWVKVLKDMFREDGVSFYSMLTSAPDESNRWVCSGCWDIIDIAKNGPYLQSRPHH
ncbi:MAG TPA: hypothetical protein VJ729_16545 [Nitrososphaeraceae archaeon]|nr:hypothetical protein [Nitrososphaeraceae archaeon]